MFVPGFPTLEGTVRQPNHCPWPGASQQSWGPGIPVPKEVHPLVSVQTGASGGISRMKSEKKETGFRNWKYMGLWVFIT